MEKSEEQHGKDEATGKGFRPSQLVPIGAGLAGLGIVVASTFIGLPLGILMIGIGIVLLVTGAIFRLTGN